MLVQEAGTSAVAIDRNWQHRVANEISTSKAWTQRWGFLAAGGEDRASDSVDKFMATNKNCTSTLSLNLKDTARRHIQRHSADSMDAFLHQYMVKAVGPSMRPLPKQEFNRPALSSHSVGWGNSLERFGPLQLRMR